MQVAIVGGGIAGLACALALHQRGLRCTVYEGVAQLREVGVGITLLPHAMRELAALGLREALQAVAIENLESVFFNRHGQFIYREPRGRHAGHAEPELGIHRGRLHGILLRVAALDDTLAGKIKAWRTPDRRPSKAIKDLGDIARLVEAHPRLAGQLPDDAKAALGMR